MCSSNVTEGFPVDSRMKSAPLSSIPLHNAIDSVKSITAVSGPAEPCPPGKPSHMDILEPTIKLGSFTTFLTFSYISNANLLLFAHEPPYFQSRSLYGLNICEPIYP